MNAIDNTETNIEPSERVWPVEVVAEMAQAGGYVSLALDGQSRAHIAYWSGMQSSQGELRYAQQTSRGWLEEVVFTTRGAQTAVALDSRGGPMIAFIDLDEAALKLAHFVGNDWQIETAVTGLSSFATGSISLVIDARDHPIIIYFDRDHLHFTRRQGSEWSKWAVDDVPGSGYYHDSAIAEDGQLHIATYNLIQQTLHLLIVTEEGIVSSQLVTSVSGHGEYVSLAIDSEGVACLCYWTPDGLAYAWLDGQTWQVEMVEAGQGLGYYPSLKVGGNGVAKVSYYDAENGRLKFARRQDSAWIVETADTDGDVGGYSSLALNEYDTAHIAYYDWTGQNIKFVRVNTAPDAQADQFETYVNTIVSGNILENDSDLEHDPIILTTEPVEGPSYGVVDLLADGTMYYKPHIGFNGIDSFTYEVCDDRGLCATAVVTITVKIPVRIFYVETRERPSARISRVSMRILSHPLKIWSELQKQDESGVWQLIEDSGKGVGGKGLIDWKVTFNELGDGPYRWIIYSEEGGYPVALSETFYFPTNKGDWNIYEGVIEPLPGEDY